jgi:lipopolysaccharide assembly outer membrane protein LptD (OstA)
MINYLGNKIINTLIIIFLGAQCLIFFLNQKPLTKNFSQKNITVENFSSIVLSKSGITKIGSEKLNKIDEDNIYLEGNSYLENKEYKIYGKNISINLSKEISKSDENVEVINNMGLLKAQGFKNLDYDGKIFFEGEVEFVINK